MGKRAFRVGQFVSPNRRKTTKKGALRIRQFVNFNRRRSAEKKALRVGPELQLEAKSCGISQTKQNTELVNRLDEDGITKGYRTRAVGELRLEIDLHGLPE